MSNTTIASNGAEVYTSRIYEIADEYISNLPDENDIYNVSIFSGMLKEINRQLFRATEPKQYNLHTSVNTADIELLNDLWEIYCRLCYQYKHRPTILRYCLMIGISRETIDNWKNGEGRGANPQYIYSIKRWHDECESALQDGAIEGNSIGCIFGLKANFQWRETAPINPQLITSQGVDTPEEIAARYSGMEKPQLPEL